MDQANYWMWMRRKLTEKSAHVEVPRPYDDSWEEQAFAEDSAGPLGGCIWPPRSYSCSFCRREFRSAQALGGHMNVHRRDRARLKQSSNSHSEALQHQHQTQIPCTSLGVQHPSHQVSTLAYNPNPNSDPSGVASPISASRVSVPSLQENCCEHALVSPSYSSSTVQERPKGFVFSAPPKQSDSVAVKVLTLFDSELHGEKNWNSKEMGFGDKGEHVTSDSELSFNIVVRRNRPMGSWGDEEGGIKSKRRRIDGTTLPFFPKTKSEVLGLISTSVEELDLELRLGDSPKVKQKLQKMCV